MDIAGPSNPNWNTWHCESSHWSGTNRGFWLHLRFFLNLNNNRSSFGRLFQFLLCLVLFLFLFKLSKVLFYRRLFLLAHYINVDFIISDDWHCRRLRCWLLDLNNRWFAFNYYCLRDFGQYDFLN